MKKFLFVLILFAASLINPQTVDITIKNLNSSKAFILSLSGEKLKLIDSVISTSKEKFHFKLDNKKYRPGFYKFSFDSTKSIIFVNDGEDISIYTNAKSTMDSLKILKSEGNKLYYSFIKLNKQYKEKTQILNAVLASYPKNDAYYKQTQNRLNEIQNEYIEFVNISAQKNPQSFVAKYIKSAQLPVIDVSIPPSQHIFYSRSNALNNVDFKNSQLVNSDLFTNKSIEYLTYFSNQQLPKELLEKEFMKAIDSLLNKAKVNQIVYQHITEYLIDGFKKYGFDLVIDYIVENYVIKDDICLDIKTEGMIKKRIDQAKYFKIGNAVPNIMMNDVNQKPFELNKISTEKILVVFYASWCPHCKELLPKLNEFKKQKNKIEIIAISLDTKKEDWSNFVKNNCPSLINVSDLEGWDGQTVNNYFIYATPTMFLLDKEKKLSSKPITFEELLNKL